MSQNSQRKETTILALSLLVTVALGGCLWWLVNNGTINVFNSSQRNTIAKFSGDSFKSVPNLPSGLFSYGGSTTWAPIRGTVDSEIQKVLPQFRLRYTDPTTGAPGSATGIKMLLNNQLAFSQSSRPIKDEEYTLAQQRGFSLREIPVAIDGIAIAVNPKLNIPSLSVAQLKDIYTGKITNWSQVGGVNLPITAYSRRLSDGGTVEFFDENVLGGEKFSNSVQFIPTTTQALQEVAKNTGGIYYASAPEIVGQCGIRPLALQGKSGEPIPPYKEPFIPPSECPQKRNTLNSEGFQTGAYPITRRLFVIVKQNTTDQQAGEAYANLLLTNQGQELIEKAGYVSLK